MTRIKSERELNQADNSLFGLVDSGTYTAIVKSIAVGQYGAKFKDVVNKKSENGLWTYKKIAPTVQLLKNDGSIAALVMHQDFTVGVYENDEWVDLAGEGNPFFNGWRGALPIMSAMGFVQEVSKGEYDVNVPDWYALNDVVVRVSVMPGAYITETKQNFTPFQLREMLVGDGYPDKNITVREVNEFVTNYNKANETDLRVKNVIVGWYAVGEQMAEANGWYYDKETKLVFLTKASYEAYKNYEPDVVNTVDEW